MDFGLSIKGFLFCPNFHIISITFALTMKECLIRVGGKKVPVFFFEKLQIYALNSDIMGIISRR